MIADLGPCKVTTQILDETRIQSLCLWIELIRGHVYCIVTRWRRIGCDDYKSLDQEYVWSLIAVSNGEVEAMTGVEQGSARKLLDALVDELSAGGLFRTERWSRAFGRVWRHRYVQHVYRQEGDQWLRLSGDHREVRDEWLRLVYSDLPLITELSTLGDSTAISSSTQPSLMARMLESLDVSEGSTVLEIGTGTGYNAALLCEGLGDKSVTTIDVEPSIVEDARRRLAADGYSPALVTANGLHGCVMRAPYDRLIATCGTRYIPRPWMEQVVAGGVVVANIRGGFEGGVVQLRKEVDGSARGRFLDGRWCFLAIRDGGDADPMIAKWPALDAIQRTRQVNCPIEPRRSPFWFRVLLEIPNAVSGELGSRPYPSGLYLIDASDGSWAQVTSDDEVAAWVVNEGGPRMIWETVERLNREWHADGKPGRERYGLTVEVTGEHVVWLDDPDSRRSWRLPSG